MRELTERQRLFVLEYTSGDGAVGNASEAARRAGYSEKSAGEQARQLLDKPHIIEAIDQANRSQLAGPLATKSINVLRQFVEDKEANPRLRLDAAKTILDRGGYIAPKAEEREQPLSKKSLGEMSREELETFIRRADDALAKGLDAIPDDDDQAEDGLHADAGRPVLALVEGGIKTSPGPLDTRHDRELDA